MSGFRLLSFYFYPQYPSLATGYFPIYGTNMQKAMNRRERIIKKTGKFIGRTLEKIPNHDIMNFNKTSPVVCFSYLQ
jgi:hypothetical protein